MVGAPSSAEREEKRERKRKRDRKKKRASERKEERKRDVVPELEKWCSRCTIILYVNALHKK